MGKLLREKFIIKKLSRQWLSVFCINENQNAEFLKIRRFYKTKNN